MQATTARPLAVRAACHSGSNEGIAMKVDVSTVLECPIDRAWDKVQTRALLERVMWPLVRMAPGRSPQIPERWSDGTTVHCRLYLFGFIPIGVRTLHFERVDQAKREMQTREHDPLVRRWDHLISLTAQGARRTTYRDQIDIDAGPLTFLVWVFANGFYRHRQRRWRTIAKTL
jgi:hypothetical protein